ncbi:MAG: hypothetical protein AAF267_14430 [Deinococcota bacterium]
MRIVGLAVLLIIIGLSLGGLLGVSGSSIGLVLAVVIISATACVIIWGHWQQNETTVSQSKHAMVHMRTVLALVMLMSLSLSLTLGSALGWYVRVRQDASLWIAEAKLSPDHLRLLIDVWAGDGLSEADIRRRLFDRAYPPDECVSTLASVAPAHQGEAQGRGNTPNADVSDAALEDFPGRFASPPSSLAFPGRYDEAPDPPTNICAALEDPEGDNLRNNIENYVGMRVLDDIYLEAADEFDDTELREFVDYKCGCVALRPLSGSALRNRVDEFRVQGKLDSSYFNAIDTLNDDELGEEINNLCPSSD